jgi:hypothetical protein
MASTGNSAISANNRFEIFISHLEFTIW